MKKSSLLPALCFILSHSHQQVHYIGSHAHVCSWVVNNVSCTHSMTLQDDTSLSALPPSMFDHSDVFGVFRNVCTSTQC
jgi:hypothetical protein